jgi:hypothetical protein
MAFVRTISPDDFQFETFKTGNAWLVVVSIGYDDGLDISYSLVVGLEPAAGGAVEYFFQIVEAERETGVEYVYWSGKDTRFLKQDDRKIVLAALLTATSALLTSARPERVEMITHSPDLPDKALVKHLSIARVFESCGYEVHTADPYHGKRVWWMERLESVPPLPKSVYWK